jgi:alpha-L-fucosidase
MPAATPDLSSSTPAWWLEARFGLFIHWGVYAVSAGVHRSRVVGGASEWLMHSAKIPIADYRAYAAGFTASSYDPNGWVRAAKEAGMGYVVVTAKHHDGFALFDTAVNDWHASRDLLKPLAEACRRHDLPLGFYYSHAQDWINGGAVFGAKWDPAQEGDFDLYLDRVAIPQITELLTRYGPGVPAVLWWDTPAEMSPARAARLNAEVQRLAPGILQNDRLGLAPGGGHFDTPEQRIPANRPVRAWETCMTTNESWGFNLQDQAWKSPATLIRQLCEVVSQGGNYLLNVGPRADGVIPEPALDALREIGVWMRVNGVAIHGASAGPFPHRLLWGFASSREDRVYLLVEDWPADGRLSVPLLDLPCSARLLAAPAIPLSCETVSDGAFTMVLPAEAPDRAVSVIELQYGSAPRLGDVPARPRPPVVPQPADGLIALRAGDAEIFGEHLALTTGPEPQLGCWTGLDSHPLWRVRLHQAGTYRVELDYAVPAHREGTLAEVELGEQRLPLVVAGTGGWGEYVRVRVGVVSLAPHDELLVRVVPRAIPVGAVMNLRAVHLTPSS